MAEDELGPLAAELGLELPEFTRRFLRSVVDPRTLEPRFALRDRSDGACSLLDGDNQCTAYAARPQGCRDFPRWPSILEDESGLARALRLCPGIEERPSGAARQVALAGLQALLERAPRPSECAFPAAKGVGPHLSGLELELLATGLQDTGLGADPGDPVVTAAVWAGPGCPLERPPVAASKSGSEPFSTQCGAPEHAPLACRSAPMLVSASGPSCRAAEPDPSLSALAAERDAFESALPWARRWGSLFDLSRSRRDPGAIELHPASPS